MIEFVAKVTQEKVAGIRSGGRAHRRVRQRRHALVGAAVDLQLAFVVVLRQGACAGPSGVEREGAFRLLAQGDLKAALAGGEPGAFEIVMATHAGMTTEEFAKIVGDWIAMARHPKTGRLYTEMVYQPTGQTPLLPARQRLQDLHRIRRRHRVHAALEKVYGIPPEQVVGSSIKTRYELRTNPVLVRLPEMLSTKKRESRSASTRISDDAPSPPSDSDGDQQMLQWTAAGRAVSALWGLSTTPMPSASGLMTGHPSSAAWTRRSTRRKKKAGRSSV